MVVKIFRKSKTFRGVRYNTGKIESGKGELVKVSGFDALKGLGNLRPEDYVNYLSALSAKSSRTVYPQFHAMISAKGKAASKEELTSLAEKWLEGMGYGDQPYLLVFHSDTANNHIHMVSTRIGRDGKKISDSFEKIRAYQELNRLLARDEKKALEDLTTRALSYRFSTRAQFMMLLERRGYGVKLSGDVYEISKFGKKVSELGLAVVDRQIASIYLDQHRRAQLRAIFAKYKDAGCQLVALRERLSGGGEGKITGYSSAFSERLSDKFGLEFLFHFKGDNPPYGYTVIDHATGQVFKGSEIMQIAMFLGAVQRSSVSDGAVSDIPGPVGYDSSAPSEEMLIAGGDGLVAMVFDVSISDDIDDEQILGRNRRRQRKARTNTR